MHALITGALMMAVSSATLAEEGQIIVDKNPKEIELQLHSANVTDGVRGSLYSANVADSDAMDGPGEKLTIRFETVRLPREKNTQAEQPDRDYDVALRLVDGNGQTLLILTEGSVMPDQWSVTATQGDPHPIDPAIFKLAELGAHYAEALPLGNEFQVEKVLLASQLALLGNAAQRQPLLEASKAGVAASSAYIYIQGIDSYWKPAFFNGSPFDHTATATYRFVAINGSWYFVTMFTKCNHGSCPSDSSMTYYRTYWGPTTSSPISPQECSGPYGLPHVCNNDTLLQQKNVYYNAYYSTWTDPVCMFTLLWKP